MTVHGARQRHLEGARAGRPVGGRLGGTGTVGTATLATPYSGQIGDDTGDHGASATPGVVLTRE